MNAQAFQGTSSWVYVGLAVAVAVAANAISTKWAMQWGGHGSVMNMWFIPMLLISPLVFVTFGWAASRLGLAVGSATIDSLLTVATVVFGLIFFQEWRILSVQQYAGLALVLAGIALARF